MQDNGIVFYRRFLSGDERGLEQLIALYQRGLLRFLYGYVHDVGLAEDILTDVFMTLYYKRSFKEQDDASLKTYIYKIARNKALNAIKKRNRQKELSLDALTEKSGDAALDDASKAFLFGDAFSPERALEKQERAKVLDKALASIKKEYRETLKLRYFDDLSPEEIAVITKKSTKQVYNLLSRGKTALKEQLLAGGIPYEDF